MVCTPVSFHVTLPLVSAQAYFMKKDIELTARKEAAEQRKAKFLKGAGGLKYTALAMAERS